MVKSIRVQKPLADRVDDFVKWLFADYRTFLPREANVINDSLLGNQYFARHEVAVIDSPLLQRLKRIKQTGLVFQVFPSATHSRFEHSLGVATLAERCLRAIVERTSIELPRTSVADMDHTSGDLAHLRMAAMLHDVGHGLCSHASEQIYELLSDLRAFKQEPAYVKNAPGEILSYLIVKSKTFQEWFHEHVVSGCQAQLDLNVIAELILGKHEDKDKFFLAQIVSSPFDADKLDYIARDSFYCGLALTVDLPRFYGMISTAKMNDHRILVLRNYVPLEQILFSKMTLFGSVYHHQKVKCLDSMLRSLLQHIHDNADQCPYKIRGAQVSFADPVEYLYATDDEFFASRFGDDFVRKMLTRFRRRDLFVRCLEISRRTVTNWKDYGRQHLIDLADLPDQLDRVEKDIHKNVPVGSKGSCNVGDVRLSVPNRPKMKSDFAFIQTSPVADIEGIEEFFPVEQWTESYAHNKWRSYVYAPRELAKDVRDAALSILNDQIGLKIDVGRSNQTCHLT